jgi:hypothetical protein
MPVSTAITNAVDHIKYHLLTLSPQNKTFLTVIHYSYNQTYQHMKIIAIALLVIGVAMLIWTGFTYTKKEKIVDAGPIQISADRQKAVDWPPYAGGILVIGGVILLIFGKKGNS